MKKRLLGLLLILVMIFSLNIAVVYAGPGTGIGAEAGIMSISIECLESIEYPEDCQGQDQDGDQDQP